MPDAHSSDPDRASAWPFVSVVVPLWNEARTVERCLASICGQDYPPDRMEILCIDGGSTDGTRERVARLAVQDPRMRLLDNPRRLQSAALNVGIQAARGEVIVRVDGHTFLSPDYVRQCVATLQATGADNVGGPMCPVGTTPFGEAVAVGLQSRFGVGDARFHFAREPQAVDTVYLGAFRHHVFDRVGLFDESVGPNEDYEMNYRIRAAGGTVFLTPAIRSTYIARSSPSALWRQYFRYGFWKLQMLRRHPRSLRWRQVVAPAFVATLGVTGLAGLLSARWRRIFGAVVGTYLATNLAISAWNAHCHGRRHMLRLPFVYAIMHLAWGLGFLCGLVRGHRP